MKTYFGKDYCTQCGLPHDRIEKVCPACGNEDADKRDMHDFDHHIRVGVPFQLVFFLVGFAGQQLLGVLISLLLQSIFVSTHPEATHQDLIDYLSQTGVSFGMNSAIYLIIAGLFFLFLWKEKKIVALFKSFASWKAGLAGLVGFLAIFVIGIIYSIIASAILQALSIPDPGVNTNEAALRLMIVDFPVFSILIFGIVGPFCEEVCYRVGLFGFLSRLGKPLAYLLGALAFGLIHFDWECFGSVEGATAIIREVVNIPTYIGAGAALCFIYDRFGFGASFTAHSLNNLVSILINIIVKE